MSISSKKRKVIDISEEADVCKLETANQSEREIHLQKMDALIEALRNETGENAKQFEALMKAL